MDIIKKRIARERVDLVNCIHCPFGILEDRWIGDLISISYNTITSDATAMNQHYEQVS